MIGGCGEAQIMSIYFSEAPQVSGLYKLIDLMGLKMTSKGPYWSTTKLSIAINFLIFMVQILHVLLD